MTKTFYGAVPETIRSAFKEVRFYQTDFAGIYSGTIKLSPDDEGIPTLEIDLGGDLRMLVDWDHRDGPLRSVHIYEVNRPLIDVVSRDGIFPGSLTIRPKNGPEAGADLIDPNFIGSYDMKIFGKPLRSYIRNPKSGKWEEASIGDDTSKK